MRHTPAKPRPAHLSLTPNGADGIRTRTYRGCFQENLLPCPVTPFTRPGALCKPASDTVFGEHDYAALDPT